MFQVIGPYVIYGIMAVFGLFCIGIFYMIYRDYKQKQKADAEAVKIPREATIAEQIHQTFREDTDTKERILYTKSGGVTRSTSKINQSVFAFSSDDADDNITLESNLESPFLEDIDSN